jgi:amino acid transporter
VQVHPKLHVPVNALMITSGTVVLLSLINIGSTTAFNAIISLQLAALMMTYAVSIACILYRRLQHPELLPHARWSLGRFGPAINAGGLAYATFIFFWCFWPIQTPVQPNTFNWAVVIFWSVTIGSGVVYLAWGRKNYVGPVALVKNHIIISGPA